VGVVCFVQVSIEKDGPRALLHKQLLKLITMK